jgi:hypothetical protein
MSDDLFRIFMILAIVTIVFIDILILTIIVKAWYCKNKVIQDSIQEPLLQDNFYYTSF